MYRSTASKLRLVNPACIINFSPAINCADGTCFSTIEPLPFTDTEQCGITFQGNARLLHVAEARTYGKHTQTLSDAEVIRNATKCSITTNEFQTLPEIRGEIQFSVANTHFYVPDQIQIVADHELPLIKQISPEEVTRLVQVEVKSNGTVRKLRCQFTFPHRTSLSTPISQNILVPYSYDVSLRSCHPWSYLPFPPIPTTQPSYALLIT